MAHYVCALILFICLENGIVAAGQTSECGDMQLCQTSVNNNCLCYKTLSGGKYVICTCTYSYSLDSVVETGIRDCCLLQVSIGESCTSDDQCSVLTSDDLACVEGNCQCQDGYEYNNETGHCDETSLDDFRGFKATVAVGTTCIVLILIIVLLVLLFMHKKAKTERQISYLRNRIDRSTRRPNSENVQNEETIKDSSPPSYNEIERGETPPPPFESLTCSLDDLEVRGSD